MKTFAATAALAALLLSLSSGTSGAAAAEPLFYWTAAQARTELAEDGIKARCRGKYERFRAAGAWFYRYFRCSSRKAGRFDLIVTGQHRYERVPVADPDPAP